MANGLCPARYGAEGINAFGQSLRSRIPILLWIESCHTIPSGPNLDPSKEQLPIKCNHEIFKLLAECAAMALGHLRAVKHMNVSEGGERYQQIIIESFVPPSSSGHRTEVLLRPLPGQIFPQDMLVEASREMRDTTKYPLRTQFIVNVCLKQKAGCRPHLYCNWRDPIVLAVEAPESAPMRSGRRLAARTSMASAEVAKEELKGTSTNVGSKVPRSPHVTPIPQTDDVASTNKEVLAQARLGQGLFREMVLRLWNGRCALTGISIQEVVIASHIKPWAVSTNQERMDPYNGLPLAASVDRLFDSGLIAFADDGSVLVRSTTVRSELAALGVLPGARLQGLHSAHLKYIQQHRTRHGFL